MKKLLAILLLTLMGLQTAFADVDPSANINIKIAGAKDNSYFLCLPNVGCLSILAATKGKIYPVFHPIEMDNIFITDTHDMQVYAQGLPQSCNVTVDTTHTINIYGTLSKTSDGRVHVQQLHCSVT